MVDTARTKSDLVTNLFQDGQADNEITEQDLRDFVESMQFPRGEIFISTPAPTTIAVQGTYVKAAGITALQPDGYQISMPANNRLQFDPGRDIAGGIAISASFTCASNNQIIGFKAAVNGTPIDSTELEHKIGTGADVQTVSLRGSAPVVDGDFVELFITNKTSTASPTIEMMTISASGAFR